MNQMNDHCRIIRRRLKQLNYPPEGTSGISKAEARFLSLEKSPTQILRPTRLLTTNNKSQ